MSLDTPNATCRIGIDVGGTFTDLVLVDRATGALTVFKEPSTPSDPSEAVERGMSGLLARAGRRPEEVELVIHGTTIGLNAIIQRRGAKMALVVSKGNRDVLEIGRGKVDQPFNLNVVKEVPLIASNMVHEVPVRILADGQIEGEPAIDADLVANLKKAKVDAVAVVLLNSYLHPAPEADLAARLSEALPGTLVTASAAIWPEIREYERSLVAVLNAYISPLMEAYFARLTSRMAAIGLRAPVYVTTNNGGTIGLGTARQRPIETVLSGPAAGVVASSSFATQGGIERIITFDMGGTSSDMAVSEAGVPEFTTRSTVGDFPLILPVVSVNAIGAGGGSIVTVDKQGVLKVGPESAGAEPGPICYGRGGTRPTITDCYLALNMLREDGFLGGAMRLNRAAAMEGLAELGARLGFQGDDVAERTAVSALRVATARMATDIYKGFAQRGLAPQDFMLAAYGGAGPTHANFLAEEARLKGIMIAPSPGTLCAYGALISDLRRDFVRTFRSGVDGSVAFTARLAELAAEMRAEAAAWIEAEGDIVGPVERRWTADLRYRGEASEIQVEIREGDIEARDHAPLAEAYHAAHNVAYGFRDDAHVIEILNLRVQVTGRVPNLQAPVAAVTPGAAKPRTARPIYLTGGWVEADVHDRAALGAGAIVKGPAVIEQEDTTSIILPGWTGVTNAQGVILVERMKS
jgi:N-methylhydantoinase A